MSRRWLNSVVLLTLAVVLTAGAPVNVLCVLPAHGTDARPEAASACDCAECCCHDSACDDAPPTPSVSHGPSRGPRPCCPQCPPGRCLCVVKCVNYVVAPRFTLDAPPSLDDDLPETHRLSLPARADEFFHPPRA